LSVTLTQMADDLRQVGQEEADLRGEHDGFVGRVPAGNQFVMPQVRPDEMPIGGSVWSPQCLYCAARRGRIGHCNVSRLSMASSSPPARNRRRGDGGRAALPGPDSCRERCRCCPRSGAFRRPPKSGNGRGLQSPLRSPDRMAARAAGGAVVGDIAVLPGGRIKDPGPPPARLRPSSHVKPHSATLAAKQQAARPICSQNQVCTELGTLHGMNGARRTIRTWLRPPRGSLHWAKRSGLAASSCCSRRSDFRADPIALNALARNRNSVLPRSPSEKESRVAHSHRVAGTTNRHLGYPGKQKQSHRFRGRGGTSHPAH
jgi:hypothetical protein